jgi:hypothetical protein
VPLTHSAVGITLTLFGQCWGAARQAQDPVSAVVTRGRASHADRRLGTAQSWRRRVQGSIGAGREGRPWDGQGSVCIDRALRRIVCIQTWITYDTSLSSVTFVNTSRRCTNVTWTSGPSSVGVGGADIAFASSSAVPLPCNATGLSLGACFAPRLVRWEHELH